MNFPLYRPRRLRRTEALRRLIRETELSPFDLILPLFAIEGKNVRNPISSMPGHFQFSVDNILREAR
ncbi:MAG TPA: porphobilinogen synthase, partial [Thermodesulfobacteriota bacterium]|nr:porphobilinogen synthase [Thermodesulfobacteriota bacterium]